MFKIKLFFKKKRKQEKKAISNSHFTNHITEEYYQSTAIDTSTPFSLFTSVKCHFELKSQNHCIKHVQLL